MKKNNLDTLELEQKIEIVLINLRELCDGALFESNIKTSYRLLGELKDALTRSDKHASQIIVIEKLMNILIALRAHSKILGPRFKDIIRNASTILSTYLNKSIPKHELNIFVANAEYLVKQSNASLRDLRRAEDKLDKERRTITYRAEIVPPINSFQLGINVMELLNQLSLFDVLHKTISINTKLLEQQTSFKCSEHCVLSVVALLDTEFTEPELQTFFEQNFSTWNSRLTQLQR